MTLIGITFFFSNLSFYSTAESEIVSLYKKGIRKRFSMRIRLQKVPFITPEYLHYTSFSWQWNLNLTQNMAGVRGGMCPAAFLLLTLVKARWAWRVGGGWVDGGVRKDKHWSMWSGAMISFVYRPFPELPELNGSMAHTLTILPQSVFTQETLASKR